MTRNTNLTGRAAVRSRSFYRSFYIGEEGQAALEFLLVLPAFIMIFLLLIDLSLMMYEYVSVSNAVREGSRFGSVNCGDGSCTDSDVQNRTVSRSGGILSDVNEVTVVWMDNDSDGSNRGRGDSVVVTVNHLYTFLFLPATMPVVSCADMRLEQSDQTLALPSGTGCPG